MAGVAIAALCLAATVGCVGSAPTEPTLPSVNFTPRVIVEVTDGAVAIKAGPQGDSAVRFDPASVPSGTVSEMINRGTRDHRLQGNAAKIFDTGTMRPGEKTTVVLKNATPDDLTVAVTDPLDVSARATIIVRPSPTS